MSSLRKNIFSIVYGSDTKAGKRFDIALLILILASVLTVSAESIPSVKNRYYDIFFAVEWFFTIIFTIEYCLRIFSHPRPLRYITSFYGIIDLISILPTYLSLIFGGVQYLVTIRTLRMLRIFRILKLTTFIQNAQLIKSALLASFHKMMVFLMAVLSLVLIIGSILYVIEGETNGFTSIPKSIYWTIVTITTVGYGDITPQTPLGQFLASIVMLIGYALIAVPTGIVTVELSKSTATGQVKNDLIETLCLNCGENMPAVANYCMNCGNPLLRSEIRNDQI